MSPCTVRMRVSSAGWVHAYLAVACMHTYSIRCSRIVSIRCSRIHHVKQRQQGCLQRTDRWGGSTTLCSPPARPCLSLHCCTLQASGQPPLGHPLSWYARAGCLRNFGCIDGTQSEQRIATGTAHLWWVCAWCAHVAFRGGAEIRHARVHLDMRVWCTKGAGAARPCRGARVVLRRRL
jgi:hypothetical protein